MVSFWVAVVTTFLGAAAAGVIPWLQTTRDQVSAARIAREYLIENLGAAKEKLDAALQGTDWWWPPVAAPPTGAWHEYHAVLRDDLGEPSAQVAETIKKLDDLNAWAVTQWGQQERRLDLVREAYLTSSPDQVTASQAVLDKLGPRYDLGVQERNAIQDARARVEKTLEQVRAAPRRVASRRRWSTWRLVLPAVLAIVAAVTLAITIQPTFTTDKLDQALAKMFPGTAVSCDQVNGNEAQWDCFVAYPATRTTAASARRLPAAPPADGLKFVQAGGTPSGLSKLLEYMIEEEGKTDKFFGKLVGEEPPVKKCLPLRSDGLPSVPEGPTASDTITGSLG
jgi:uncharacterized protein YfiM (DUF2279 family)